MKTCSRNLTLRKNKMKWFLFFFIIGSLIQATAVNIRLDELEKSKIECVGKGVK